MTPPAAPTVADESQTDAVATTHDRAPNVGQTERVSSVAAGAMLAALGLTRRGATGLVAALVGGAMIHRGVTGRCAAYRALGVDTAKPDQRPAEELVAERGIRIEQAFLVDRSPEALYAYWRDLANLPRFMRYLERVEVVDDRRSRWFTRAPAIAGRVAWWDAEITQDEPGALIAWRTLPGSEVVMVGSVRFERAPGDRGTEVRAIIRYVPPAGRLGHWVATALGKGPGAQIREDLRQFKRLMELGEVPSTSGQPRGTCLGHGSRAS